MKERELHVSVSIAKILFGNVMFTIPDECDANDVTDRFRYLREGLTIDEIPDLGNINDEILDLGDINAIILWLRKFEVIIQINKKL